MNNENTKIAVYTRLFPAIKFAIIAHHGQMRSGTSVPYITHPLEVAEIIDINLTLPYGEYGEISNPGLLNAAILHDVIEDTDVTFDDINNKFGKHVAELVLEVSDDPKLTKKEQRKALKKKIPHLSLAARAIKIADAISNVKDTDFYRPANWNRSLKLAFAKTCNKVVNECVVGHETQLLYLHKAFENEYNLAKHRLSKLVYAKKQKNVS